MEGYLEINRAYWDSRAFAHAADGYGVDRYVNDPAFLSHVVRYDRRRLGPVDGLRAVHLQCHIGTDTISLARLGADVVGLDLSPVAVAEARALAARCGLAVEFVESEVYGALDVLAAGTFDLVYTGIGALCWLPKVARWAATVAALLKPGGRLFMREGHPMLWAMADHQLALAYPYFEVDEPYREVTAATYVETSLELPLLENVEWNHGLGQIVTALLDAGMEITALEEHDSVPWNALPGLMTLDDESQEWRLAEHPERLAATYTLQAVRR